MITFMTYTINMNAAMIKDSARNPIRCVGFFLFSFFLFSFSFSFFLIFLCLFNI